MLFAFFQIISNVLYILQMMLSSKQLLSYNKEPCDIKMQVFFLSTQDINLITIIMFWIRDQIQLFHILKVSCFSIKFRTNIIFKYIFYKLCMYLVIIVGGLYQCNLILVTVWSIYWDKVDYVSRVIGINS